MLKRAECHRCEVNTLVNLACNFISLFTRLELIHIKKTPVKDIQIDENAAQTMRRLKSQGMTIEVEEKVVRLKDAILKANVSRTR